jgi:hypothetical protein
MDGPLTILETMLAGTFVVTGLIKFAQTREALEGIEGSGKMSARSLTISGAIEISTAIALIALMLAGGGMAGLAACVVACAVSSLSRVASATTLSDVTIWNFSTTSDIGAGAHDDVRTRNTSTANRWGDRSRVGR